MLRPANSTTSLTQLLLYAQIGDMARKITERAYGIHAHPSYQAIIELNDSIHKLAATFPSRFNITTDNGSIRPFNPDGTALDFQPYLVQLALQQQLIRLNLPFLTRGHADSRFAYSREVIIRSA